MTESQRPLNPAANSTRGVPPLPPPPPAMSTMRQSTQTLELPVDRHPNRTATTNSAASAPPPPTAAPSAHRPGTPPPMATSSRPKNNNSGLTLAQIIQEAFDKGYSDIHLGVGEVPRFRNRGEMQPTDYPETDKPTFMEWMREIMTDAEIHRFEEQLEFDGATQYEFARVRINIFDSLKGYAMVLRLIPLKILTMEQLRLPTVFKDICHYHKGLILVTGPTGSGKSTTMAAMIDYINSETAKHIITIEDPIEFVHRSKKSLIKQREVGMHTRKFDNALKAALREDPDLILVGEMRDKETVNTALKAAQTGHLVMGTLHTNSAVKTIERILNLYNGDEQDAMRVALAESLVAVIAQGLCRTTDGKRAAFHDVLINTDAVKDWVKEGKYDAITELMKQASFDGMVTMNQSLLNLYSEGRITEETALEMSPTPNEMAQFLRGRV
ncbi:type IV pili twitching motility protein PilT [Scytonema hofmannii PCC 7110]|uniref:Type IV pili twitching motility protein PilT n=1 Tax=Scytonema hofmannii PCC 7110 TaxID=128403 RepID=A0A139WVB8_9CYAN|nr:type IV pilus twitching motility protein PilT [Scytonema hofmannii]KYC36364.1 type IV pili twitching motility protein PilT [Scytonema hofmannii PCC 7110]